MNTILVPFHDDEYSESALGLAELVARRNGGHIEALYVLRPPQIFASEGIAIPGGYITELADEERSLADRARARFDSAAEQLGLQQRDLDGPAESASASWRELEGLEPLIVGEHGRLFGLIVVGRASQHAVADWNATCEAAMFDSGRAVLVAPETQPDGLGKRILIAWNCSTETAHTVYAGREFLREASEVQVLTVTGGTVPGPAGEEMAAHLRRAGVDASARTVEPGSRSVGETILAECDAMGADMLFKGAYTHTRLRQMIFGGATRYILTHAKLPVLMAH
ncbi:MAG: universal stress protein [Pseudomonadota bacterium]